MTNLDEKLTEDGRAGRGGLPGRADRADRAAQPTKLLLHACCGPCSMEPVRTLQERGVNATIYYANSNIHPADEYAHRLATLRAWAESDDPQTPVDVVEGDYDRDAWEATVGRIGDAALEEAASCAADPLPGEGVGTGHESGARTSTNACTDASAPVADADANKAAEASSHLIAYREALAGGASPEAALTLAVDPAKREARCRACYRMRFEEAAAYAADHGFDALGTTLSVSPYQYTDVIREELERAAAARGVRAFFEDYRPYYDEATRRSRARGMYRQNFCGCRISDLEAQAERAQRKAQRTARKAAEAAAHADERAAEDRERAARRSQRRAYNEKQARKRAILKALREQGKS